MEGNARNRSQNGKREVAPPNKPQLNLLARDTVAFMFIQPNKVTAFQEYKMNSPTATKQTSVPMTASWQAIALCLLWAFALLPAALSAAPVAYSGKLAVGRILYQRSPRLMFSSF